MKKRHFSLLIFLSSISAIGFASAQEARPPVKPIQADKIVLVGDSTTAVLGGWGPSFCAKHVTSFLACVNLARGGRSTYNYRAEGSWDIVQREMRSGGYRNVWVLVQFGHNDQPGKPGRSTDLATEFPANLRRYVEEIRAAGAHPVLLTPLTRRQFKDGQVIDDLAPWADAVRSVANELKVPLVDLHVRSRDAVQGMGPVQAMRFAQLPAAPEQVSAAQKGTTIGHMPTPAGGSQAAVSPARASSAATATPQDNVATEPMGQAKLAFDYTHLGQEGANFFAAIVADELARAVPQLRKQLIP
ncbi:rhamnogalacturonan acetylesterase [Pseudoxanthomonas sp. UTMC 1351]|uniref:rhamnogalacturonan acetylesterase n=1 Tax=Pseudoxanthomonas sp. UTMC 1351 TaxID=2695853 RepID=UPI0034CDFB86